MTPLDVARRLIAAFGAADFEQVRSLLADDLRAYVTKAEGGVDEVIGAAGYLDRVEMDGRGAACRERLLLGQLSCEAVGLWRCRRRGLERRALRE